MPVNMDKVRKAKEETDARRASYGEAAYEFMKWQPGPNQIRCIPPFAPKDEFWMERKVCFNVGPNKRAILPLRQFGHQCPLMDNIEELYKRGDDASKAEADKMWPKNRVFFWIIDRAVEEKGPKLVGTNLSVYNDVLAIMTDPDYGDITDPEKGTDLMVNYTPGDKTANGFPDWQVMPKRSVSALGTPEQMSLWLSKDWFDEYKVGQPDAPEYIKVCMAGTEEEYWKQKRATAPQQTAAPTDQTTPVQQPAVASQPPPTTPMTTYPSGVNKDTKFWRVGASGAVEVCIGSDIAAVLLSGVDMQIMQEDQAGGWTTATALGFALGPPPPAPAPVPPAQAPVPPAQAPPTQAPAPPVVGGSPQSEEAGLQGQLNRLKEQTGASQVGEDLRQALS